MSAIRHRAGFEGIRYAQVWEDADVLLAALAPARGGRLASICSGGDNVLALLVLDPEVVVAADFSPAQLACLRLRIEAYRRLDHGAVLELLGSCPSGRRGVLLDRVAAGLDAEDRAFWARRRGEVEAHGAAGIGKFERYFRLFRRRLLPLVHGRARVNAVFEPRGAAERERFLDEVWSNRRWRLLLRLFFSRRVMGWLGRDPAFFDHAEGSVPDHVARRIRQAFVAQDPGTNPYLRWLLTGAHARGALPLALRPEHFDAIRARLDRVVTHLGPITEAGEGRRFDGFNLSDVFEYMDPAEFEREYGRVLALAAPGARLAYWNMMAPRRRPDPYAGRAEPLEELSAGLHAADRAFFYSAFRVDEVAR